uniref:Uncharacterized protein n=1 Tax=Triticum urartu TaxID=4572 RepID=A0A8R7RDR9_TRIUA
MDLRRCCLRSSLNPWMNSSALASTSDPAASSSVGAARCRPARASAYASSMLIELSSSTTSSFAGSAVACGRGGRGVAGDLLGVPASSVSRKGRRRVLCFAEGGGGGGARGRFRGAEARGREGEDVEGADAVQHR